MKRTVLREYARLIVRSGANVQKGQEVLVFAALDQPEFVRMVADESYKAGAKRVTVRWTDDALTRLNIRHQSLRTLGTVEKWEQERMEHECSVIPATIHLVSDDPDGLRGVNMEKLSKSRQMRYAVLKPYSDRLENKQQWTIAAVPGEAWARKVFPGVRVSTAVEKLWQAILSASRVNGDSVHAWKEHNERLKSRCDYLNRLHIRSLHYYGDNGTDFTVGLMEESRFCGGGETSLRGVFFNPNIPTEECFTTPRRGVAEGTVYATKPLSYRGQLIENFSIRFEGGKAVEVHAEKGEELLKTMISMDEGAAYLGECALVPQNSPIAETGMLFFNTLFDENAACHLALGMGFADTVADYENRTLEECRKLGVNDSMIHEDFMIGYEGLNIDALCADGSTAAIFRNGNWAL